MKNIIISFLLLLLLCSCANISYVRLENLNKEISTSFIAKLFVDGYLTNPERNMNYYIHPLAWNFYDKDKKNSILYMCAKHNKNTNGNLNCCYLYDIFTKKEVGHYIFNFGVILK